MEVKDIIRNGTNTGSGDFDAVVVLRNTNLTYFECKAGSFDDESIMKCYERMLSLNCEYSIIISVKEIEENDLQWLSQKVKIPVVGGHSLNKINVKNNPHDPIYDLLNCYLMDMDGNIENKIKTILRINSAKINHLHYGMQPDDSTYKALGYDFVSIQSQRYD